MAKTRLSNATYVERGYGQVEPNHLSAQRTGQIYAQLPAAAGIDVLENGQFVKYDYAAGVVDFTGAGEWMLVYNEVKVYRDHEGDADFAMIADNYVARVYSPVGDRAGTANARNYNGVVAPADPYEVDSTADPFVIEQWNKPAKMPEGTKMVPRVFKTNVGDIFTTNCLTVATSGNDITAPIVGDIFTPEAPTEAQSATVGILTKYTAGAGVAVPDMQWQVVKVYTLPDRQRAVKLMRIK